jgi:mono/diheme cytochrome c family protein
MEASMRVRFLFLGVLLIFAFTLFSQQSEAPKSKSKAPATAGDSEKSKSQESHEKAKKLYGYDCAMCHGETGDGKGDLSADYASKLKDLTDPATLKDVSDDQLFTLLKEGKGDMPPEGKRVKDDDLHGLVQYVRTLAKK